MKRSIVILRRTSRRLARAFRNWRNVIHKEPAIHPSVGWWRSYYYRSVASLLLVIWLTMAIALGFKYLVSGVGGWSNVLPVRPCEFTVDINAASWPELTCLPGIGEVLAKRIVALRSEIGPFSRCEDLLAVPGIGPKTVEKIRPFLRFGHDFHVHKKNPQGD